MYKPVKVVETGWLNQELIVKIIACGNGNISLATDLHGLTQIEYISRKAAKNTDGSLFLQRFSHFWCYLSSKYLYCFHHG